MSNVEKMTIALTTEQAGFVRRSVAAGEYASTSEAIREAVREWKERRDPLGYSAEQLRFLVQEGDRPETDGVSYPAAAISRGGARCFQQRPPVHRFSSCNWPDGFRAGTIAYEGTPPHPAASRPPSPRWGEEVAASLATALCL